MGRIGFHPHIVGVLDLGEESGQPYMVTEFMAGGDVESLIHQAPDHRLPLERTLEIAKQMCQGLQFAHAKGIVHRDLKPGNVWLGADGTAKIGDFGLALPLNRLRLTREGMMVGTVAYMAPEQATGQEVTPKADLYALGCMLYEMVAGRPPFLGDDPVAVVSQHVHTPPVASSWHNPRCPRDLEALILRLLGKDPAERPADAAEVLTALEGIDLASVVKPAEETRSLDSLAGGVFVGRQREMGELKAALEEALSGHGRLMMLVGEPGVGKTRAALELATYAGLRQTLVLWGRCYEEQGMPPYWPWVQAIRGYVRERDPQALRAEMGSGAPEIAQVVSEVRERLPNLPPAPTLDDPESARFRLFDAITTFLKGAARSQPLLLILDDLHWADKPSLLLLQFLAGELANARLLVVGAYRDVELSRKHPLAQALGGLTRERGFQRVLLRGLSHEDVGRFIELTSGIKPPRALVHAVHTQTEGNPLFINEVVRLLVQEGELRLERLKERQSWTVRIPEGVREVIGRRLDRLSERCNQVLGIASVIGREFSLAQLGKLVEDLSEDRLLEALEEGLAARVIEELPRAVGRYQFTHGLIQETLVGELSTTRRVRLHARIAQALEALYGVQAEAHAGELAYHYGEAEAILGTDRLVHYARLAGERALAAYAPEEAVGYLQRGLAAKEGQPVDDEMAALLYGLGRAEVALVLMAAGGHLKSAFDYYAGHGDIQRSVAVASVLVPNAYGRQFMAPLVERALQMVPPESLAAGPLLCARARYVGGNVGDYEGASLLFRRAVAIARREHEQRLELHALALWTQIAYWNDLQECRETIAQTLPLLDVVDSPWDASVFHHSASLCCIATGDISQATAHASASLTAAERLRDRDTRSMACFGNATLAYVVGDWATARAFTDRALVMLPDDVWSLGCRMMLECEVGDGAQAEDYLERLLELERRPDARTIVSPFLIALAARVTGDAHRFESARAFALRALTPPGPYSLFSARIVLGLGLMAAAEGDAAGAAEQYRAYGTMPARRGGLALPTNRDRLLGIIAHGAGLLDKAVAHFEDALAFCRKAGYGPELAWTCCDYTDLLLKRNAAGDDAKAASLLDEALAIAQELGMRPLAERVQARRKSCAA